MASSKNLASLEPWAFRPYLADSWISEAYARDTETLTKALQKSFSNQSETLTTDTNSSFLHLVKPEPTPTPTASGSDPETAPKRRNAISATAGKISKRKSRSTKRSPTTFITADPANFRQMVQQVTGIRFGDSHVPVVSVLKPEPQRPVNCFQSFLPTLDTSAFLLDHHQHQQVVGPTSAPQAHVSFAPVVDSGAGLDFDCFQSFPTLESWRVV
ncbi:hypothetical protein HHK36_017031 [Tetracentron sinense]|uniref:VQ domain-containing protein n=1 Tax=Tetracentron sinense TaxID=13715 RepID=A0A834Y7J7_TETSI|nr:hypothetical protein HHK36_032294 [Tetracentron sinense]KAF8398106.1 hypothetical protein HHK36_017031 [Tetracentron sinense]